MNRTQKTVVIPLIVVNVVFFLIQLFMPGFTEQFMLVSSDILSRPWTMITSMFLHGSPGHLLLNMFILFQFGLLVEQRIGSKRFLPFYFIAGIVGSIAFSLFVPDGSAVGASGAIMGVLGMSIMLFPNLKVLFFFMIPMTLRTASIIFVAIEVLGMFNPHSTIGHAAHLGGLACGLIYGWYLTKEKKKLQRSIRKGPTQKKTSNPQNRSSQDTIYLSRDDIERYKKYGRL
jgi:membrane associated rhomboid family serine protease